MPRTIPDPAQSHGQRGAATGAGSALLLETGSYLLLETSDHLLL
jgi:hypothetical protein